MKKIEKIDKRKKEKYAVINFYKNQGININASDIILPEENDSVDAIFGGKNFQIKNWRIRIINDINKEAIQ